MDRKQICLLVSSAPKTFNVTVTFMIPCTPYDCPPTPAVRTVFFPKTWPPPDASNFAMFALMLACKHPASISTFIICALLRKCIVTGSRWCSIGASGFVQQGGLSDVVADSPPVRLADCVVPVGSGAALLPPSLSSGCVTGS